MLTLKNACLAAFCLLFVSKTAVNAQITERVHLIKKTILGGEGGWDYLLADAASRRLYVSHGNQVEVLNADTHEKIGVVADTKGVHGIAVTDKIGFITCGRTNTVWVFDVKTLQKISETAVGNKPDAVMLDKFSNRVFCFNNGAGNVIVFDATSGKAVDSLALGGAPEAGVTDGKGQIFVNIEDKNEVVAFDAKSLKINGRWSLLLGKEPTGLAIDVKNSRLFSVCQNNLMMILDAKTGTIISQQTIGGRPDGAAFDAENQLAYSSNGDGTLTVVKENKPTDFKVLANVPTQSGARTITYDEKTHHVFTITAQYGEKPAATTENPKPRAKIIPNTFTLLEFGQ